MDTDPREFNLKLIAKVNQNDVKRNFKSLLRKKDTFNLEGTKEKVTTLLNQLLKITPNENKYLNQLYKHYEFKSDLILKGENYNPNLNDHPKIKKFLNKLANNKILNSNSKL